MYSEDYKKKLEELKERFKDKLPKDKPYYISVKDEDYHIREQKTHNDTFTENLKDTLKDWKDKGYILYKKKPEDLPNRIYLRFVKKDGRVLNGGVVLQNKIKEDGYMHLRGVSSKHFSVQIKDIKEIYYRPDHYEKQMEAMKEREKKKEQKQKMKEEKERKKQDKIKKKELKKKKKEKQEKAEEAKEEAQEAEEAKQEEQEAKEQAQQQKKKKAGDEEKEKILHKYYYEDGYTYGRDRLHKKLQDDGHKISRTFVDKWLKQQALYELIVPSKTNIPSVKLIKKLNDVKRVLLINKRTKQRKKAYALIFCDCNEKKIVDEKTFRILLTDQQVKDLYEEKYLKT